jgi:putative transposase
VKVREAGRIVSVAATITVDVNGDSRHEVFGMAVGASEAETFCTDFPRGPARLAWRELVISNAHKGLKAAVGKELWRLGGGAACIPAMPPPMPARPSAALSWPA